MSPTAKGAQKPIPAYLPDFLDYCEIERGLSDNTQRNYKQYLLVFLNWLKKEGHENLRPKDLSADHIWDYRLYLARSYKTPHGGSLGKKSQNYYLIALRALVRYFAENDITSLPSTKIKLAKQGDSDHISFLEITDVEALLAVPDLSSPQGFRDRAILELFFSSGMRISELTALNADHLSFLKDRNPSRTFELSIVGKGKRVRTVFISPRAAEWLRKYLATRKDIYDPLFTNSRSRNPERKRLSSRYIQSLVSRCARLAGLSQKVTPHTLRHTYATDLLTRGADLRSVQELLGHKNVATTQIYTHVTNKRLRDVHERFHGGNDISAKKHGSYSSQS